MLTLEGISPVPMPTYLHDQKLCTLCSSMICEDELHMLECGMYDELGGEYGIASVQLELRR